MISPRQIGALGACVLLAASGVRAADAGDTLAPSAKSLFRVRADALRKASAKDSGAFAGFLDESFLADGKAVRRAWGDIVAEFPPEQLADFFAGANVIAGPASQRAGSPLWSGVLGLYNPWWDAILLLRLNDELCIDRLALHGGEAFRDEPSAPPSVRGDVAERRGGVATVVPVREPLSLALQRVQSKTAARFRSLYPEDAAAEAVRIPPRGVARDLAAVKARAALRERLMREFLTSSDGGKTGIAAVAGRAQDALRHGDAKRLRRFFADPARHAFCDAFAELPTAIREGFALYGYVPADKGTLFVFLNPSMPRLYATVAFPAGREKDPAAGDVVFEWFDLASVGKPTPAAEKPPAP